MHRASGSRAGSPSSADEAFPPMPITREVPQGSVDSGHATRRVDDRRRTCRRALIRRAGAPDEEVALDEVVERVTA